MNFDGAPCHNFADVVKSWRCQGSDPKDEVICYGFDIEYLKENIRQTARFVIAPILSPLGKLVVHLMQRGLKGQLKQQWKERKRRRRRL